MKMRKNIVICDIEVSPNYFLIGMKLLSTGKLLQIDTQTSLTKDQKDTVRKILANSTLVTFNGLRYDMPIILRTLCQNITTKDIFEMSKRMIDEKIPPYRVYNEFDIDTMRGVDHVDLNEPAVGVFVSLKGYGARMHSKKLQDLPYAYDKVLTDEEIDVIRKYNVNDLDTTIDLFNAIRDRIELREDMSEQYGLDLRSKSDAQIAETVIVKELTKAGVRVSPPKVPETVTYKAPKCVKFKSMILKQLLKRVEEEEFKINPKNGAVVLPDWLKKYPLEMDGTKYQIGIGGLHSKEKKLVLESDENYVMRNIDVASYYPSMILEFGFYPPRFTEKFLEVYGNIYKTRLKAKRERNMVVSDGLKIVLNGSFGKLGSMYSKLYAPDLMLQVTLTGQLMLLMLIEELRTEGFEVSSSNTDGIELLAPRDRLDDLEALVLDWELETGMVMEHGQYKALYARDVNNYVAVYPDEVKAKGVYAKPTLSKNSEYPIVFEAIRRYLFDNTVRMEDTIRGCTDVRQFLTSRTVKTGGVWKPKVLTETKMGSFMSGPTHEYEKAIDTEGGIYLGKVVRWYYSVNGNSIHYKSNGNKVPKSDGAHPMMELSDSVPDDLDYDKYIALAVGHLEDTGVKYEQL